MDDRNRLLTQAYREYNENLSFMVQTLSNVIRIHSETQTTYNNNMRSLFALLHSTSLNMDNNHNAIIDNIRSSYPLMSPIRTTVTRNTEPVFNNNNRSRWTRTQARGRYVPNTMIAPVSPNRLRLSREFLNEGNAQHFDSLTEMMNNLSISFQNVNISPSLREIQTATRCYNYTIAELEDDPDLRCPITHEEFEVNEEVCVIRHCNHKFKKEPLYQWFNSNVRCPVCRFDIREHIERNSPENTLEETFINDVSLNPIDASMNVIETDISFDILREALRGAVREFEPGNIVSVELPIPINRTNSGTLSDFFRDLSNNVI